MYKEKMNLTKIAFQTLSKMRKKMFNKKIKVLMTNK